MQNQKFGVEIEMTGISRRTAATVACAYFGTDHVVDIGRNFAAVDQQDRFWKFVYDGSIRVEPENATPEYKVELVSPVCEYADLPMIQGLVDRLKSAGAVSNDSCGIHVHVDGSPYTAQSLRNIINIVASKEDILYRAVAVHPDREKTYAKKLDKDFLKELNAKKPKDLDTLKEILYTPRATDGTPTGAVKASDIKGNAKSHPKRYSGLNLHSFFTNGTVEFRMFNSDVQQSHEVTSYAQLCLGVSNQALSQKHARYAPTVSDNEKYTFRVWLLRLGMIGDEFKTARTDLLKHLTGNVAWKDPHQAVLQKERFARQKAEQEQLAQQQEDELFGAEEAQDGLEPDRTQEEEESPVELDEPSESSGFVQTM